MTVEVKVPQLPESVADATLVTWHKQPGDAVRRDENLADLETDKVVLEVPCPVDGVMGTVHVAAGATVIAGSLLAEVEEGAAAAPAPVAAATTAGQKPADDKPETAGKPSPAAKRLLEENKLAAAEVPGSGKDGRITKGDVSRHLSGRASAVDAG
ncbi:MAG: biotin/lipoyl-containing protein, partial [Steroidobacteraceae bacterium]